MLIHLIHRTGLTWKFSSPNVFSTTLISVHKQERPMYLTQGLQRGVQQQPDQVMTIFGGRRRTFREVAGRVARLAGALRELGVGDGDRVAMLSLNSDRYHEYLLAVPWAHAVLNPVNFRWSQAEIAYSLRDSDSRVLMVDDQFAAMVPGLREAVPGLATVIHT